MNQQVKAEPTLTQEEIADIRRRHPIGLKGLRATYTRQKFISGCKWPGIISSFIYLLFLIFKVDSHTTITDLASTTVSVLPNLLGFLLGGYTILIGFGNVSLLKATTVPSNRTSISFFQTLSAVFAFSILAQATTLVLGIFFHYTLLIEVPDTKLTHILYVSIPFLNSIGSYLILFLFLYCVFALRDMVVNIFTFAQMYHQTLTIERIIDKKRSKELD